VLEFLKSARNQTEGKMIPPGVVVHQGYVPEKAQIMNVGDDEEGPYK
jgi:hypothetical protein